MYLARILQKYIAWPGTVEKENSKHRMPFTPSSQYAKNTSTVIQCVDCGKWRCVYSKYKLKHAQMNALQKFTTEFFYTCDTCIQDAEYYDDEFQLVYENVYVKANLTPTLRYLSTVPVMI